MDHPIDTRLVGRDYISTQDWNDEEIGIALDTSDLLKKKFYNDEPTRYQPDRTMFMIFFDKSTRTRNAFEAGITQLGGHAHDLNPDIMQISHGETPRDTGIILSRYGHCIAIRHDLVPGEGNTYLRAVAEHATIPVINLQCDVDHPTQTLADLMTMREQFGKDLRGRRVAVSWAFAPSYTKPMSVPQGLIMLLPRFGVDVVLAHPPEYDLMPETVEAARENAKRHGTKFEVVHDMDAACEGAHVLYPKSWGAQHVFGKPVEAKALAAKYTSWICDERRMGLAASDGVYMHCLPADRGNEVTDAVIDGPRSVVFDEAENRLHTAKALMALTMTGKKR